jgi:hypothetical protein
VLGEGLKIMADQFTTRTQEALSAAVRNAAGRGNAHVEPIHVLSALLAQRDGIATALLAGLGVDLTALSAQVERAVAVLPAASGATVASADLAQSTYRMLKAAGDLASARGEVGQHRIEVAVAVPAAVHQLGHERDLSRPAEGDRQRGAGLVRLDLEGPRTTGVRVIHEALVRHVLPVGHRPFHVEEQEHPAHQPVGRPNPCLRVRFTSASAMCRRSSSGNASK